MHKEQENKKLNLELKQEWDSWLKTWQSVGAEQHRAVSTCTLSMRGDTPWDFG